MAVLLRLAYPSRPITQLVGLLQMLLDEGGFAYAFSTHNADKLSVPVYLIHLIANNLCSRIGE